MDIICCFYYIIKQDVLNFKMSKFYKKIIKQFNKFFIYGKKKGEYDKSEGEELVKGGGVDISSKEEIFVNYNLLKEDKLMEVEQIKKILKLGIDYRFFLNGI